MRWSYKPPCSLYLPLHRTNANLGIFSFHVSKNKILLLLRSGPTSCRREQFGPLKPGKEPMGFFFVGPRKFSGFLYLNKPEKATTDPHGSSFCYGPSQLSGFFDGSPCLSVRKFSTHLRSGFAISKYYFYEMQEFKKSKIA